MSAGRVSVCSYQMRCGVCLGAFSSVSSSIFPSCFDTCANACANSKNIVAADASHVNASTLLLSVTSIYTLQHIWIWTNSKDTVLRVFFLFVHVRKRNKVQQCSGPAQSIANADPSRHRIYVLCFVCGAVCARRCVCAYVSIILLRYIHRVSVL